MPAWPASAATATFARGLGEGGSRGKPAVSPALTAAVDRDRELERDLLAGRGLGFEARENLGRAGCGDEQASHDLLRRLQLHELLLERPREAPVAEVPAVELLQKARGAALAELADRLADEEDQLGGDLLARRLVAV